MNGDVMFGIRSDIDSLQSTQHPYLLTVKLRELVIEILEEQRESDLAQLQFMQRNGINQNFPQRFHHLFWHFLQDLSIINNPHLQRTSMSLPNARSLQHEL